LGLPCNFRVTRRSLELIKKTLIENMPNQHKEYVCHRLGCNRSFRRDKYLEHLKVCLGTRHPHSIWKKFHGNLTKTWFCS